MWSHITSPSGVKLGAGVGDGGGASGDGVAADNITVTINSSSVILLSIVAAKNICLLVWPVSFSVFLEKSRGSSHSRRVFINFVCLKMAATLSTDEKKAKAKARFFSFPT